MDAYGPVPRILFLTFVLVIIAFGLVPWRIPNQQPTPQTATQEAVPITPGAIPGTTLSQVLVRAFPDTVGVYSLAFSPDGKTLAAGFVGGEIGLWDVTTGHRTSSLAENTADDFSNVNSLAFSPDGKMLASASADRTIRLWDVTSRRCLRTLAGHTSYVFDVKFSPDGMTLASASHDTTIKLWAVASGKLVRTLSGHATYVGAIAFSPDGKLLASGAADGTVKLWDVATGDNFRTLVYGDRVDSVVYSPDGKLLAAGSGSSITLWNAATRAVVRTIAGHNSLTTRIAFSPDGKLLAAPWRDNNIKLWRVADGGDVATLECGARLVSSVMFSPDGKTVASASGGRVNGTVQLWDLSAASITQLPAVLPVLPTPEPPKPVFHHRGVLLKLLEPEAGGVAHQQTGSSVVNEILGRPLTTDTGATAYYSDEAIAVAFSVITNGVRPSVDDMTITLFDRVESCLAFSLSNLTSAPIVVIWDRCSMQLPAGGATNVMHSGQRYIARSEPTIPTTVVQGGVLADEVIPSSVVYYSEITKEWTIPSGALEGGPFWFTLAVEVSGELRYYNFKLLVAYGEPDSFP